MFCPPGLQNNICKKKKKKTFIRFFVNLFTNSVESSIGDKKIGIWGCFRDRLQISLLILSEFKRINLISVPLEIVRKL